LQVFAVASFAREPSAEPVSAYISSLRITNVRVAVVLGYGLYLLQAALLHTWQSVYGEVRLRRLIQSALPALAFSLLMIYLAVEAMIQAGLSLR
jgi:hypothetical protein